MISKIIGPSEVKINGVKIEKVFTSTISIDDIKIPEVPNRPGANSPREQEHLVIPCCRYCGADVPVTVSFHKCAGPWK